MKGFVVNEVIKGAAGMFRWASMQLQYLCSFSLDSDIKNSLGRPPPDLHTLYAEIYNMLSTKPGELQATVFMNVLYWLLCARTTLKTEEFLAAVSINPQTGNYMDSISKDIVLEICNNFVVFDSQLDTFRFAHLSVREFLEQRSEFSTSATNALAAEVCLWSVLSTTQHSATEKLFLQLGWHANTTLAKFEKFRRYADVYWASHCKSAGGLRNLGRLEMALRHFVSGDGQATSSISLWNNRLHMYRLKEDVGVELKQLDDAVVTPNSTSSAGLFVSCTFDFEEQIEDIARSGVLTTQWVNKHGHSPLQVAARNGSCATLRRLLELEEFYIEITEEVVREAAGWKCGKEVMTLLLNQRGADIPIREEVVATIVQNFNEEVIALLLDRHGADVLITDEVVRAVARNWNYGNKVMTLLLERREEKVVEIIVRIQDVQIRIEKFSPTFFRVWLGGWIYRGPRDRVQKST